MHGLYILDFRDTFVMLLGQWQVPKAEVSREFILHKQDTMKGTGFTHDDCILG